jgi:hypothetical protein
MSAVLQLALMPYMPDIVFPTEALLGLADALAEGRHGDALSKFSTPVLHESVPGDVVTGFSFVPGFAGVPPTPPCSPTIVRGSSSQAAIPSASVFVDRAPVPPTSSPVGSPVRDVNVATSWYDDDSRAFPRAPASSPVHAAGSPEAALASPLNHLSLCGTGTFEVSLTGMTPSLSDV